jgi:hypothetical protein
MACFERRRRSECPSPRNLPPMSGYASFLPPGAVQINLADLGSNTSLRGGADVGLQRPRAKDGFRAPTRPNLLGLPSACVPAGRDEATGLPTGVLITGRRFRENACLEAAKTIEAGLGLATPIDAVR